MFFDNLRHMEICKANNSKIEKLSGNSGKGFYAPVSLENFILHSPLIWFSVVSSFTKLTPEDHQPGAFFIPFLAEGFGLNFDLIETNILNLAVVLGVVLYLGGDVLTSLLNDRKQKILGTLKSANERFVEAEQKLAEAKQKVQRKKKIIVEEDIPSIPKKQASKKINAKEKKSVTKKNIKILE